MPILLKRLRPPVPGRHPIRMPWGSVLVLAVALSLSAVQAQPTLEQVRALPPLPKAYGEEASAAQRLRWLRQALNQPTTEAERYRLRRVLFGEHFGAHRMDEAATLCKEPPPLREDFVYRGDCLVATHRAYEAHMPMLLALAAEARELGKPESAARLLKSIAWRQSQAGDIASSFENYEAALSLVPGDATELLGDLMMDTASAYIVNGDDGYVRKGIALLEDVRRQMERELADPHSKLDKALLRDNILLTEFNRGIAYVLHLDDYEKALQHFDKVVAEPNTFILDALSFAALAAAELRQHRRAKAYLDRASKVDGTGGPVVEQYLQCYRQLAARHAQPGLPVTACLHLSPDTTTEVQLDLYKRLSGSEDPALALAGLKGLKALFLDRLEPQLRRRGSSAASNAELRRLQRESELKSVVLQQQAELQRARDATNAQRQNYFAALSLLLLMVVLLVASRWRAKKKLAEQYHRLSLTDTLTQLGNRRFLEQHIARELSLLERARRKQPEAALGVYLFDVDHFKSINDRYGHAVGDEVLVTLSRRIQSATRATDLLVRWGGEEFLLVARLETAAHCAQVAERILGAVNGAPFAISGHAPIPVSCTIGAVRLPFLEGDQAASWPALVSLADLALYEGKASGRNRWMLVHNLGIRDAEGLSKALQLPLQQLVDSGQLALSSG